MSELRISARQLAGEQRNEARKQRAIQRTPAVVVGLLALLTLVFGISAAVDLRRLDSPEGTTRAWVQAALDADCTRYAELSVAPDGQREISADQCALVAAAVRGLTGPVSITISGVVLLPDQAATADVMVTAPGGAQRASRIQLSRASGAWLVVRTPSTCALLTCP